MRFTIQRSQLEARQSNATTRLYVGMLYAQAGLPMVRKAYCPVFPDRYGMLARQSKVDYLGSASYAS